MALISVILGWLLGILSPAIVKKIAEKTEKDNLKKIIFNDLKDLKKRLASISYLVYPKYGKLDKETFDWLKINSDIDFSEGIKKIEEQGNTEDQIITFLNARGLQESTATHFKKMHLFAIDSHLMNFGLIENTLIEKVLEIRFHVEAFNEEIDSLRESLNMTFLPGITPSNHRIVSREVENKSLSIAMKSMFIVDKINIIIESSDAQKSTSSSID